MTYSPYNLVGSYPSGPVRDMPWCGLHSSYPDGTEDFSLYSPQPGVPDEIECSSGKSKHDHLDVTSGCLDAVLIGSENQYTRGQVRAPDSDFRVIALGYDGDNPLPIKWTDCGTRFRFFHKGKTGDTNWPGIKAFIRYRTEDDLYVASWRFDRVVQIQRKWAGAYTVLAIDDDFEPPAADAWHWFAFEALGARLRLFLDETLVMEVSSSTFSWGTAGIRIDSADGCYLDDWSVYQPVP